MIDGRLKKGETRERDGEGNERRERKEHVTWARVHYSGYIFWFTVADSLSFEPLCTVWTPTIHPGCSVYVLFGLSVCLSVCLSVSALSRRTAITAAEASRILRTRTTYRLHTHELLPARRYTSAVLAVVVCPSVCPSVRHKSVFY